MPNWKKVITSGSNAHLNQITSSGFNLVGTGTAELEVAGHITASGNISSSGDITGDRLYLDRTIEAVGGVTAGGFTTTGNTTFGNAATDTHTFTGHITASQNISSSGNVITSELITSKISDDGATNGKIDIDSSNATLQIRAQNNTSQGLKFYGGNVGVAAPEINTDTLSALNIKVANFYRLNFSSTNTIFNQGNGNYDFQIDGDTNDKVFFLDAGTEKVGISTNTPASKLTVFGDIWASGSNGHITASGNISASGFVTASGFKGDGSGLSNVSATVGGNTFATDLKIGRDADNLIDFTTDNQITFRVSTGNNVVMKASGEIEATSLDISGDIDVDGTANLDAVDIDGNVDAAGSITMASNQFLYFDEDQTCAWRAYNSPGGRIMMNRIGGVGGLMSMSGSGGKAYVGINIGTAGGHANEGLTVNGMLSSSAQIHTKSHITASGNISSSGKIITEQIQGPTPAIHQGALPASRTAGLTIANNLDVRSHITASGNISSSGNVIGAQSTFGRVNIDGKYFDQSPTYSTKLYSNVGFHLEEDLVVGTHITASGNISASNFQMPTGGKLFNTSNTSQHIDFNSSAELHIESSTIQLTGPVTRIIASSNYQLDSDDIRLGQQYAGGANNVTIMKGHITASGDISASGFVTASGFKGDGSGLSNVSATVSGDTFATDLKIGRDSTDLIDFSTADNVIGFRVGNNDEMKLTTTALHPATSNGSALGLVNRQWSDLFLAEGAVINFDNGDVTITQTANDLAIAGTTGTSFVGHITASGNISSSNTGAAGDGIYAASFFTEDNLAISYNSGYRFAFANNLPIQLGKSANPIYLIGNVTASGNISSSGDLFAGSASFGTTNQAKMLTVQGDISASDDLIVGDDVYVGDDLVLEGATGAILYEGGTGNTVGSLTYNDGGIKVNAGGNNPASTTHLFVTSSGGVGSTNARVGIGITADPPNVPKMLTVAGDISSSGNYIGNRQFDKTSNTDATHQGDIVYFGGTTSMDNGKIYHYKSDGTWELVNADAVATSDGLLGVALGAASDTNGMLLRGMVTLDHDPGAVGDVLFISGSGGNASATAPALNNNVVRVVGYCLDASNGQIWFNPSSTFVEVSA